MKKNRRKLGIVIGLATAAAAAGWSLAQSHNFPAKIEAKADVQDATKSDDDADKPIKIAPRVSNVNGTPTITLDDDAENHGAIETVALTNTRHARMLRAYGSVLDLQSLTDLANKYANAKADMETQQAKRDLSHANVERAHALYDQGPQAISKAQLEAAEAAFHIDAASVAAAHSQLTTLAQTAVQAWGAVLGRAITEPSPLLLGLVERRNVLVQVTLRADQTFEKPPTEAFAEVGAGGTVKLHFVSPAALTDPHIQGPSFFYTAAADSGLLPGMNLIAYLASDADVARAKIPADAVVWLQGRAWAYFRSGPKTLVRREITTDAPAPDGGYFVKDVPDGTEIVSRGAQMLLSEEFRAQIQTEE